MLSFERIAVASTFSPRFLPLLAEAKAFTEMHGAKFSVLHVGERNAENEKQFADAFVQLGIEAPIHWLSGEPAEALVRCVRENKFDLLIAGALEKEAEGRTFLGQASRVLMREAPCSLLLFTKPSREPKPLRTIVTATDFS